MSALTVSDNKAGKKPQYKDYVSFLGTYKSGRKDDQCSVATSDSGVSFSLNNSSNNSSSSINSDLTDQPRNGFKEYLEHYNNKKYSSVQPAFIKKQKPEEAKTVKTEVYIEINNANNAVSPVSKVFEINNGHNPTSNVSKVSKIFENNGHVNEPATVKPPQPSGKVNTFKFKQTETSAQNTLGREQRKTSIGEISKKFEANSNGTTHKVPLKKTPSISEKSKLFEDINHVNAKKNLTNETPKPKEDTNLPKTNGSTSPKPPINAIKPVLVPKTFESSPPPQEKPTVIPAPPPLPPIHTDVCTLQNTPLPPSNVPPPPPPPPANFTPKTPFTAQKTVSNNGPVQNGKKSDAVDGVPVPVVDKNDPRVKRLVYGALREMYGAYHDKANDYIATLPKNRVKKNNGLDSIINSIASQGGLEKLNGRINPAVENE